MLPTSGEKCGLGLIGVLPKVRGGTIHSETLADLKEISVLSGVFEYPTFPPNLRLLLICRGSLLRVRIHVPLIPTPTGHPICPPNRSSLGSQPKNPDARRAS